MAELELAPVVLVTKYFKFHSTRKKNQNQKKIKTNKTFKQVTEYLQIFSVDLFLHLKMYSSFLFLLLSLYTTEDPMNGS